MNIKLDRYEVCKVLLALTAVESASNNAEYSAIHDKLKKQLEEWDENLKNKQGGYKNEQLYFY